MTKQELLDKLAIMTAFVQNAPEGVDFVDVREADDVLPDPLIVQVYRGIEQFHEPMEAEDHSDEYEWRVFYSGVIKVLQCRGKEAPNEQAL